MTAAWALLSDPGTRAIPELVPPAAEEPVRGSAAAVAIDVGVDEVRVHGTSLARTQSFAITNGRIADADRQGHLVTPLRDVLAQAELDGPIAITAADATPWPTLLDLLYTAGRAGARRYAFVTKDGTIAIDPPTFDPHGDVLGPPVAIELAWQGDAIVASRRAPERVALVEARDTTCVLIEHRSSTAASARLRATRDALCSASRKGVRFVIAPSPTSRYRELVEVASTLRDGADCPVMFTIASGDDRPHGAACTPAELHALTRSPE
ncbi:MAG TPA: hypothetical protein VG755_33660 [Nannocystaceae bacterium]|nr:hypothetical protein [Nannocystaceae bacterium]